MITKIYVNNFKSLSDFSMPLCKFNCLIGLNGAGKTTVLQVMDFLGHLACGETDFRNWKKSEIITIGSNLRTIAFEVNFIIDDKEIVWSARYNIEKQKITEELIYQIDKNDVKKHYFLNVKEGRIFYEGMQQKGPKDISDYNYKGSVLSAFKFNDLIINRVQYELQSLKSLELISPNILRQSSLPQDDLGIGGEGLSGFLSTLSEKDVKELISILHDFYPQIDKFEIKRKRYGWKALLIKEAELNSLISAKHINDGYLRVLAMLSQKYSKASFLLFDEIENGINQELIEKLLLHLQNFKDKQIMVTTHSALVLNYLDDDVAKDSVVLLSKDGQGYTRAYKFFEIPEIAEKIEYLAPGQVMSQTNLNELRVSLIK